MDELLGIRAKKKIKSLSKTLKYISNNNLKTMFPNTKELMNI